MQKPLLIIGLDPGTTLAYALLDLSGNLLHLQSTKSHTLSSLITQIISHGLPVITSTDVTPIPNFVHQLSSKLGTRLISPQQNLTIKEKKTLTQQHSFQDLHQRDALASALHAHKTLKPLLTKIHLFLQKQNRLHLLQPFQKLLLTTENLNFQTVLALLTQPQKEETKIIKKTIEKTPTPKDFLKIYNLLQKIKKENILLQTQNQKLKNSFLQLQKNHQHLFKRLHQIPQKTQQLLSFKEKRLHLFSQQTQLSQQKINSLQKQIHQLHQFLLADNLQLLKKLDNLGSQEFQRKHKLLKIKENDSLLIKNPNLYSENLLNHLKNKNIIIIYEKSPGKKLKELPFLFINKKNLTLKETPLFAFTPKKELEKQINKQILLKKIIQEYQTQRK